MTYSGRDTPYDQERDDMLAEARERTGNGRPYWFADYDETAPDDDEARFVGSLGLIGAPLAMFDKTEE